MLHFSDPTWLWGLPAVAAVAAWAIFRPARQLEIVGSLELWQQAVERLDRSRRLRGKGFTLSWLLLLAGAMAAVAAAARPVLLSSAPARSVAIELCPSAEVARPEGMAGLRQAAEGLLDRLSPGDRVQLLLPESESRSSSWLTADEARRRIRGVLPLPVPAAELLLPPPDRAAQAVYRIAPAGAGIRPAPGAPAGLTPAALPTDRTLIEIPTALPDVTLDALAATPLSDGNVQVFLALRNHLPGTWEGGFRLAAQGRRGANERGPEERGLNEEERRSLFARTLPPGRSAFIETAPPDRSLSVNLYGGKIGSEGGSEVGNEGADARHAAGWGGYLVRRDRAAVRVAFVGGDDPLIRRFVRINPELAMVEDAAIADVLVCVGRLPPAAAPPGASRVGASPPGAGRPALVIHPSAPPPGCREGAPASNLVLGEEGVWVDSQDPVMRDTNLSGVAVRSAQPWALEVPANLKALCGVKGRALIARTTPELLPPEAGEARRIYLAFATDTENTNFGTTESFVIFLASAFRWLEGDVRSTEMPPSVTRPAPPAPPGSPPAPRTPTAAPPGPPSALPTSPPVPPGQARYEYVTPKEAAFAGDWAPLAPAPAAGGISWAKGPYPPPGLYRDGEGRLHAVSLVGLRSSQPKVAPRDAVAAAPLPPPQPTGTTREAWVWLAAGAIALWLAGWAARGR